MSYFADPPTKRKKWDVVACSHSQAESMTWRTRWIPFVSNSDTEVLPAPEVEHSTTRKLFYAVRFTTSTASYII